MDVDLRTGQRPAQVGRTSGSEVEAAHHAASLRADALPDASPGRLAARVAAGSQVTPRRRAAARCIATVADVAEVIPIFPLSHVLLPGMPLPLHVFEPRYRDLLEDIADAPGGARFGVVVLRSGTEALNPRVPAGVPDVEEVGTVAEILELEPKDDGTSDLLSVGSRRFRIESLVTTGKPYLRADVSYLDEDDGALDGRRADVARELMEAYDNIIMRLAGRATGSELPPDANQLSYHIGARLPLPPHERQRLLVDPTTAQRLARVNRLLRREIALLKRTRTIAVSPTVLRLPSGVN
jgi:Lon protease-like protein